MGASVLRLVAAGESVGAGSGLLIPEPPGDVVAPPAPGGGTSRDS